jgi:hypothetical protein
MAPQGVIHLLILWLCLSMTLGVMTPAWAAAAPAQTQAGQIPHSPSTPPSLNQKVPPDLFNCKRKFVYQGRTLDCDSELARDGENLRPIVQTVPEAESELNIYQRDRSRIQKLAYVGSVGLASALIGTVVFRRVEGLNTIALRNVTVLGGLGLVAGSTLLGLALLSTNESHLSRSVDLYNQARPSTPIQIQFSTGF